MKNYFLYSLLRLIRDLIIPDIKRSIRTFGFYVRNHRSIKRIGKQCDIKDTTISGEIYIGKNVSISGFITDRVEVDDYSTVMNSTITGPVAIRKNVIINNSIINRYSYFSESTLVMNSEIGPFCSIATNVTIGLSNHPTNGISTSPVFYSSLGQCGISWRKDTIVSEEDRVVVGPDVWIGANALVKGGVAIGVGSVIAAGAVVTKDVPPFAIVGGIPARIIKFRFSQDTIDLIIESRWWEKSDEILKAEIDSCMSPIQFIERVSAQLKEETLKKAQQEKNNLRQQTSMNKFENISSVEKNWPWQKSPCLSAQNSSLPKITIVTPSYNQGEFLEETIRSVLMQGYPNLEYIIMDGGSTDNSVAIIKKYEDQISYWVSEKDNGQADAIYRGFERASGDIIGWLNSDDVLLPNALMEFGRFFSEHENADLVVGGCVLIDEKSNVLSGARGFPYFNMGAKLTFSKLLWIGAKFNQPATLWKRKAFFDVGGFDRSLHFCFDFDMFLRLTKVKSGYRLKKPVAAFRLHGASKTGTQQDICNRENQLLFKRYGRLDGPAWLVTAIEGYYKQMRLVKWRLDLLLYLLTTMRWPFKSGRLS